MAHLTNQTERNELFHYTWSRNGLHLVAVLLTMGFVSAHAAQPAAQSAEPIVFVASAEEAMPLAQYRGDVLEQGILKDLGEAIAKAMHRRAQFVTLPRKRSETALTNGTVDGVCYARKEWTDITLNWSKPFIPNSNLLVASGGVEAPGSLSELKGQTIGTVLGYRYPELEATLGNTFRHEDAPNMASNIEKLRLGHIRYAVVDGAIFSYEKKRDDRLKPLATLTISSFSARCGFSPASKIPFSDIDAAIDKLVGDGSVKRVLDRYR